MQLQQPRFFSMYRLFLILSFFVCAVGSAQSGGTNNPPVALTTIEGKPFLFSGEEELSVVIFLSPGCPLSQKYTLTLNGLANEFAGTAKLYGVFAETDGDKEEYLIFRRKYNIAFELLVDSSKQLAKALAATVTPEAFVLQKGAIVYHGAIDDWAIDLGKTKNRAAVNFVRSALQSAIAGTVPATRYSKPVGCFID